MYQIDTLGLEFETTAKMPNEFFKHELIQQYFRTTHDASIESPISHLGNNMYFIRDKNVPEILNGLEQGTAGVEIVSSPLTFSDMEKAVPLLIKNLYKYGARDEEERAGIHIHCAFPISIKILKNTIRMCLAFESLFFHLGGMGYTFRGEKNSAIFCRPLSSFGPPVVKNKNGYWIQLLDTNVILQSNDLMSFWKNFGGIDMNNPPNRYHPARYFFINPFSAFLHSTLEFRVFNTTLNIDYILASMRFCQEFTNMCFSGKNPFDFVSSIYNPLTTSQELLDRFFSVVDLELEHKKTLFKIIEKTPLPKLESIYTVTHLRDYQSIDDSWHPKIIDKSEIKESGFIDIHNFNGENGERRTARIPALRNVDVNIQEQIDRITENARVYRNSVSENPIFDNSSFTTNISTDTSPIYTSSDDTH